MAARRPSVLLVEDHEDTRKMLELLFDEWGYSPTMVGTATEGLRCLLANRYDIIILDNWLPDLEGIELCRQIRGMDRHTPIVFYSAAAMGSEDRAALAEGATAYIYKGSALGLLRQAMSDALSKTDKKSQRST